MVKRFSMKAMEKNGLWLKNKPDFLKACQSLKFFNKLNLDFFG